MAETNSTAQLKVAAKFPLVIDNKTVGHTTVRAGAKVTVLQRKDEKVLVSHGAAGPAWMDEAQISLPTDQETSAERVNPGQARPSRTSTARPKERSEQAPVDRIAEVMQGVASMGKAISGAFSGETTVLETKQPPAPQTPTLKLWANKDKTEPGLNGFYFNEKLGETKAQDLKTVAQSRRRLDENVDFGPKDWGNRKRMRLTGGSDRAWHNFSVQWDGWVELDHPGSLTIRADDGSRMWLDANQNGEFENSPDEFLDNGWGDGRSSYGASQILEAGTYRIRLHYEGREGENFIRLEATDGSVVYEDFEGNSHQLFPWLGRNVVLLTKSREHDRQLMERLVGDIDQAYDYFVRITGRQPPLAKSLNGKNTVAELESTCGVGCGLVGATGVELTEPFFRKLIEGYEHDGSFNHLVFWEFSRNFWFHQGQLDFSPPDIFDPGAVYATVMQALCLRAADLKPDEELRRVTAEIEQQIDDYAANDLLNFDNTVRKGKGRRGEANGSQWLLASVILRLHRDFGGDSFLAKFWQAMTQLSPARSTQEAVDNLARMACEAAEQNLTPLLVEEWKFPVSAKATDSLRAKWGEPKAGRRR